MSQNRNKEINLANERCLALIKALEQIAQGLAIHANARVRDPKQKMRNGHHVW
jgi:hypothetical protein